LARLLSSERGAASLLYVIMISAILMIAAPAVLLTVSNDTVQHTADRNTQMATKLAVSGLETFIAYLDGYSGDDSGREAYFNSYDGFVTNRSFVTPEGLPVALTFTNATAAEYSETQRYYRVVSSATVGSGPMIRTKTVEYLIDATAPDTGIIEESYISTDPSDRQVVTQTNKDIYVKGSATTPSSVTTNTTEENLQTIISTAMTSYKNAIPSIPVAPAATENITALEANALACTSGSLNCSSYPNIINLNNRINGIYNDPANLDNPVVIRVPDITDVYYDGTYTWGTAARPVILIFPNGLKLGGNKINVNITGDLIVKGNFEMNGGGGSGANGSSLKLYKDNGGQYGNLIATGNVSYSQPASTIVQGAIRSSNLKIKGGLSASNLYTTTSTEVEDSSMVSVADGSIYTSSYTLRGSSVISTKNLYATGNINITNTGTITATGNIYAYTLDMDGGSTVSAANLYLNSNLYLDNNGKISVSGETHADNVSMSTNQTKVSSGKLLVYNNLTLSNSGTVQLTSDLFVGGSVDTHTSGTSISSSNGDLFIKGDFSSANNVTLKSGGVIAVGGNFNINPNSGSNSVVQTGGGTTSLILEDSSGGSSGGGGSGGSSGSGTPAAWRPTRITH
jgi:hypothetical protein